MTRTEGAVNWRVFAASWALLTLLSFLWTLSTPIGAAPDEPAHLIKAASVVRGQFIGTPSAQGNIVSVPAYIGYTQAQTCYAFAPNEAADCIPLLAGDPMKSIEVPTSAGLYNPTYYMLVGWPSLIIGDSAGIFAMRFMSAVLSSGFLALVFAFVSRWPRRALPLIGSAVAVTPMVLFLNGTVNPNGLEIAATLAAFVGVISTVRQPENRTVGPTAVIVFASAALAANMRGLSLLWLAVALLAPVILAVPTHIAKLVRMPQLQLAAGGVATAALLAAAWLASTNFFVVATQDPLGPVSAPGIGTSPFLGFAWTLSSTLDYALGMVGIFGWLDTPAPTIVYFIWAVLFGGLALLAFTLLRGRSLLMISTLAGALLLLPALLQGIYIVKGGVIWQGRYILPLFACLAVALGTLLSDRIYLTGRDHVRLVTIASALLGFAQFAAFATAMRRYAVGLDGGWLSLLNAQWAPPGGIWLLLTGFALAVLASYFLFARLSIGEPAISGPIPPTN